MTYNRYMHKSLLGWLPGLLSLVLALPAIGQTSIPDTYPVFHDDFERGSLEEWYVPAGSTPALASGEGHSGSTALAVAISPDPNHVTRGNRRAIARADEAYLTFWFNPNGLVFNDPGSGYIPNRSIELATIRGPTQGTMVAIRLRAVGGGYQGFLTWRDATGTDQYDYTDGSFAVADAWQQVTLGFRKNQWVACWIGGANVRTVTGVSHSEPYGSQIQIGKTNQALLLTNPTGTALFDDVSLDLPRIPDLWVDGATGSDSQDGLTPGTAFATVSRASDLAGAGTTVHIQPGTYREAVAPAQGGVAGDPVVYEADSGPGTVVVRGSDPGSSLTWQRLSANTIGLPASVDPQNVWWTDLSSWGLQEAPGFVVRTDGTGAVVERLPMAREPDWSVPDPQRYSLQWWVADGGASQPACDPSSDPDPDCDAASRSATQLTDGAGGPSSPGAEVGDLTALGSLVGGTVFVREAGWGQRLYRRTIVAHDVTTGRVTLDQPCLDANQSGPGLGWGSQYFVEGLPRLLDSPGEWWFDPATGRLYLWPPVPGNPSALGLEISRRETAFDLDDRSDVTLQDLDLDLFNGDVIQSQNLVWHKSVSDRLTGCRVSYSRRGVLLSQAVEAGAHDDKRIEGFVIESNTMDHLDHEAVRVTYRWDNDSAIDSWTRPGVFDTTIRGNQIHDVGFRVPPGENNHAAIAAFHPDHLTVENNTISDQASAGIQILGSVDQSASTWGFSPDEIKVGSLLIRDNVVERACQLKNDCGGLRFVSTPPDSHVFRDVLVMGNTFRDSLGWSWEAQERGRWASGQIPGAGGMGLYLDHASGVDAFRNVLYNNGFAGVLLAKNWRDGRSYFFDNVAANNAWGFYMGGLEQDTHVAVDTRVENNILINNEAYGLGLQDQDLDYTNIAIDRNLYFADGWGSQVYKPGVMKIGHGATAEYWQTLSEVQANTFFEAAGQAADPTFLSYDLADHDRNDGSRPDFRLRTGSPAVDAGTTDLPPALLGTLSSFGIVDSKIGAAYDQGAFEGALDCLDVTVSNQTVSTAETFSACGVLTLGPTFQVTSAGNVTALAGERVVITGGFSVAQGASFVAGKGGLPP